MQQVKVLSYKTSNKSAIQELEQDFLQRMQRLAKVQLVEINSLRFSKLPLAELLKKEASLALEHISPSEYLVLLSEFGKEFTSEGFAQWIDQQASKGNSRLVFLIASPNGFAEELAKAAKLTLSLSKMTFTSQFARMLLLEQLYRAFAINNNLPYHKAGI